MEAVYRNPAKNLNGGNHLIGNIPNCILAKQAGLLVKYVLRYVLKSLFFRASEYKHYDEL